MTDRLVVTSVVRHAGQSQASGFFRIVDTRTKQVLCKFAVPESAFRLNDPNPRGGLRGARGMSCWGDRIVIANTDRLLVFDKTWSLINDISHPWMGAIHDILADESGIWVTSTSADLLLKLSWTGELIRYWSWREDKHLIRLLGFSAVPRFDPDIDYRDPIAVTNRVCNIVHLNAVNFSNNEILLSFGRILSSSTLLRKRMEAVILRHLRSVAPHLSKSKKQPVSKFALPSGQINNCHYAIVSLAEDNKTKILYQSSGNSVPNHNIIHTDNMLIFNNTYNNTLAVVSKDTGKLQFQIPIPGESGFNRGLLQTSERRFWVGNHHPAAIYEIDIEARRVINCIMLGDEVGESVYAICSLPNHFETPNILL